MAALQGFLPVHLSFEVFELSTAQSVDAEFAQLEMETGVQIFTKWKQAPDGTNVKVMLNKL